jgi:hypothetical protein
MKPRGWMFLRVLINRYHQGLPEPLLEFLPQEDGHKALAHDIGSPDLTPLLDHAQIVIKRLHYSWLKPVIEKFSSAMQPFFIASLPRELSLRMQRHMDPTLKVNPLADSLKPFFLRILYDTLDADDRLPIEYLPDSPLSLLVGWSKKELVNLIDFLGLHDLSGEIRQVVAKQALSSVYECLSPKQTAYLKMCLHQKDSVKSPPLKLNFKQLDCALLLKDLHRRGLMRLGKALSGQHPDLIWYLSHTLDTGRGSLLSQFYSPQPTPKITQALTIQVVNVMNFLKKSAS